MVRFWFQNQTKRHINSILFMLDIGVFFLPRFLSSPVLVLRACVCVSWLVGATKGTFPIDSPAACLFCVRLYGVCIRWSNTYPICASIAYIHYTHSKKYNRPQKKNSKHVIVRELKVLILLKVYLSNSDLIEPVAFFCFRLFYFIFCSVRFMYFVDLGSPFLSLSLAAGVLFSKHSICMLMRPKRYGPIEWCSSPLQRLQQQQQQNVL